MLNRFLSRFFGKELINSDHIEDIRDALEACCEAMYWAQYEAKRRGLIGPLPMGEVIEKQMEAEARADALLKPLGMWPSLPKHRLGHSDATLRRRALREQRRQKKAAAAAKPPRKLGRALWGIPAALAAVGTIAWMAVAHPVATRYLISGLSTLGSVLLLCAGIVGGIMGVIGFSFWGIRRLERYAKRHPRQAKRINISLFVLIMLLVAFSLGVRNDGEIVTPLQILH